MFLSCFDVGYLLEALNALSMSWKNCLFLPEQQVPHRSYKRGNSNSTQIKSQTSTTWSISFNHWNITPNMKKQTQSKRICREYFASGNKSSYCSGPSSNETATWVLELFSDPGFCRDLHRDALFAANYAHAMCNQKHLSNTFIKSIYRKRWSSWRAHKLHLVRQSDYKVANVAVRSPRTLAILIKQRSWDQSIQNTFNSKLVNVRSLT